MGCQNENKCRPTQHPPPPRPPAQTLMWMHRDINGCGVFIFVNTTYMDGDLSTQNEGPASKVHHQDNMF